MHYLGLDIGTTTVSAAVIDTVSARVLMAQSLRHHADLSSPLRGAHLQDADQLVEQALALIEASKTCGPLAAIGVTGQMHGVVYTDSNGLAVSPLHTWLDKQAEAEAAGGRSYQQLFADRTGRAVPVGYGALTHFTQTMSGRLPPEAASLCTIADYLVMRLCRLTQAVTDPGLAHSLGLFDTDLDAERRFDTERWGGLGADVQLPTVSSPKILGRYEGVPVVTALGDNQASFLGSVKSQHDSVLVTLGTSGQLSGLSRHASAITLTDVERRPFLGDDTLLVGASLTGGKAFELLASFVNDVVYKVTGQHLADPYTFLEVDLDTLAGPYLAVDARFAGSRHDSAKTGTIAHIGLDNFDLAHLAYGFAQGIVDELHAFWKGDFAEVGVVSGVKRMVGSGNLLRSSRLVRRVLSKTFDLPLVVPNHLEEAAVGAAIHAAAVVQAQNPAHLANSLIREEAAAV